MSTADTGIITSKSISTMCLIYLILLLQILNTIFKQTNGNEPALYLAETNVSFQSCHFDTQSTVVDIVTSYELNIHNFNLRMFQSTFILNTSDQNIKIIHCQIKKDVSWMLWKTKFQINPNQTIYSNRNFIKYLDKIVSYDPGQTFHGTISETQYASGNILTILPKTIAFFLFCIRFI